MRGWLPRLAAISFSAVAVSSAWARDSIWQGPAIRANGRLWKDADLKTERTRIGNVLGRMDGKGRRLLLAAHGDGADEAVITAVDGGASTITASTPGCRRSDRPAVKDALLQS